MTAFLAILVTGVGTYLTRASFIVGLANRTIPQPVSRGLEFVGPAVLAALVVTLLVDESGRVAVGVPELAGLAAAGVVGWRTRGVLWTVLAGMAAFWGLQLVL